MAKSKRSKLEKGQKSHKGATSSRKKTKRNWWQILIVLLVIIMFMVLAIRPNFNDKSNPNTSRRTEIKFTKEGDLSFFKKNTNQEIKNIDLEIADKNRERMRGLMYRYKMNENTGMLFIMDREEPQSFWMRNTYISLDIIYLDKDLKIVTIQKYTKPLTDDPVPSFKKAKYVLEVVAGYCDKFEIEEGDYVKYKRVSEAIF